MSGSMDAHNAPPGSAPPDAATTSSTTTSPVQGNSAAPPQTQEERKRLAIERAWINARANPVDPWGDWVDVPRACEVENERVDQLILRSATAPTEAQLREKRRTTREAAYAELRETGYQFTGVMLAQWLVNTRLCEDFAVGAPVAQPAQDEMPIDQAYSTYIVWGGEKAKNNHELRSKARGYPNAVESGLAVDPPRPAPKPATPSTASTRGGHSSSAPRGGPSIRARGNTSRRGGSHQSAKPTHTGGSTKGATYQSAGRGSGRDRGDRSRDQRGGGTWNAEIGVAQLNVNPMRNARESMEGD